MLVAHILKASVAQQQMDNQQQNGETISKERTNLQVPKAARELLLQPKAIEKTTGTGSNR
jgi:hypothetical protein